MKKTIKYLVLLPLLCLMGCKDDCPQSCPDGRIKIGNDCMCPSGTVEYQGACKEKHPSYFWVDSTTCGCISGELFIAYNQTDLKDSNSKNNDGSFTSQFTLAYNNLGRWTGVKYYPKNDSLYFWWFSDASFFDCQKNSFATGKFYENKNKLKLDIFFFEGSEVDFESRRNPTDSCTLWMSNRF
ncbi:MAG: hypothetical protein COA58_07780 [Bacteroidetes bacterium]|nr:MAG: hypothetical protein COA58_07780 [Bacteroidota bacterium]